MKRYSYLAGASLAVAAFALTASVTWACPVSKKPPTPKKPVCSGYFCGMPKNPPGPKPPTGAHTVWTSSSSLQQQSSTGMTAVDASQYTKHYNESSHTDINGDKHYAKSKTEGGQSVWASGDVSQTSAGYGGSMLAWQKGTFPAQAVAGTQGGLIQGVQAKVNDPYGGKIKYQQNAKTWQGTSLGNSATNVDSIAKTNFYGTGGPGAQAQSTNGVQGASQANDLIVPHYPAAYTLPIPGGVGGILTTNLSNVFKFFI